MFIHISNIINYMGTWKNKIKRKFDGFEEIVIIYWENKITGYSGHGNFMEKESAKIIDADIIIIIIQNGNINEIILK